MTFEAALGELRTFLNEWRQVLPTPADQPRLATFDRSIASCNFFKMPGVIRPNSSASLTPLSSSSASGVSIKPLSSITMVNLYVNSSSPKPACGLCGNVFGSLMSFAYPKAAVRVSFKTNDLLQRSDELAAAA